jgi:hypothetical protein
LSNERGVLSDRSDGGVQEKGFWCDNIFIYTSIDCECPRQVRVQRHTERFERDEQALVSPVRMFHLEYLEPPTLSIIEMGILPIDEPKLQRLPGLVLVISIASSIESLEW